MLPFFSTETWILIGTVIILLWYYVHRKWQYFEKLGIPHRKPYISRLGSMIDFLTDMMEFDDKGKAMLGNVYGQFSMLVPSITIHDPEMLQEIFIKQFSNFPQRVNLFTKSQGNELNHSLTQVVGEDWKRTRNTMTPSFSTAKLKLMHKLIDESGDRLVENLNRRITADGGKFKTKDVFGKFSLDVVLRVGFGADVDAQDDEQEADVVKNSKKLFTPSFYTICKIFPLMIYPPLEKITSKLGMIVFDVSALEYMKNLSYAIMKKKNEDPHKKRVDLMQLMMDAKIPDDKINKVLEKGLTNTEIIGNAVLMILAGYENTANTIGFFAYNLAMHPDIQQKLYEEIKKIYEEKGRIDYDSMKEIKYLDMCLNESMRLYLPILRNARIASRTTTVNGITIEKDMVVGIPAFSLARDKDYWDKPLKYNPERMRDMSKINPMVFQPFGNGPRNCIAKRFALMEVKLAMIKMLLNFRIEPNDDTPQPPLPLISRASVQPKTELTLKVVKREES